MRNPIETYQGTVYPWHCDHMGHMNVMWYVGKFDEATWSLFAKIGITPGYVRANDCGMVAVRQVLEYQQELTAGAVVVVRSRLLQVGTTSLRWIHEMINSETGALAATCEVTGVHFDRSARMSCALPPTIVARVEALLA